MADLQTVTAQDLLQVMMLLIRSFSANMRQGEGSLEPAQAGILMRLGIGACTLSELAQHQAVKLPTVSRSVSVLVKAGLIRRWTPEDNRRITMLELTPEGRRKQLASRKKAETHVRKLLAPLSETERLQVDAALNTLIRTITQ